MRISSQCQSWGDLYFNRMLRHTINELTTSTKLRIRRTIALRLGTMRGLKIWNSAPSIQEEIPHIACKQQREVSASYFFQK